MNDRMIIPAISVVATMSAVLSLPATAEYSSMPKLAPARNTWPSKVSLSYGALIY